MIDPRLVHLKTFVKENMPMVAAAYRSVALYFLRKKDARRFVNEFIRERRGCVVQYGPFRGMRLLSEASWGMATCRRRSWGCMNRSCTVSWQGRHGAAMAPLSM
jgi:hypothetical protein